MLSLVRRKPKMTFRALQASNKEMTDEKTVIPGNLQTVKGLIVLGLVYDMVGVSILARAFAATPRRQMMIMGTTFAGGNQSVFDILLLQRWDAQFGLAVILIGFLFQIAGVLGAPITTKLAWFLWIALIPACAAYEEYRTYLQTTAAYQYDKEKATWRTEAAERKAPTAQNC